MIAVRWEFKGDDREVAAAQTVVHRILTRYRPAIDKIRCPLHGSGTTLTARGHTLEDLDLIVEPCCKHSLMKPTAGASGKRSSGPRLASAQVHRAYETGVTRSYTPVGAWFKRLFRNHRESPRG